MLYILLIINAIVNTTIIIEVNNYCRQVSTIFIIGKRIVSNLKNYIHKNSVGT